MELNIPTIKPIAAPMMSPMNSPVFCQRATFPPMNHPVKEEIMTHKTKKVAFIKPTTCASQLLSWSCHGGISVLPAREGSAQCEGSAQFY